MIKIDRNIKLNVLNIFKPIVQFSTWIAIGILVAILIQSNFLVLKVSGTSMEPFLKQNDYVVVNRIFKTQLISTLFSSDIGQNDLKSKINSIKRNDILVFNKPNYNESSQKNKDYHIKRCVAISGDIFSITDGVNYVENVKEDLGDIFIQRLLSNRNEKDFEEGVFNSFPFDENIEWNIKNFGPLYVPKVNDVLEINNENYILYKTIIIYETGGEIIERHGTVLLNNKEITHYKIQKNYFFVVGDWLFNSNDSRYWGFLPEDYIIGKVDYIMQTKEYKLLRL